MPEGVELTLSKDYLVSNYLESIIDSADLYPSGRYRKKPPEGYENLIFPFVIISINTKGKFMWWILWNPENNQTSYMFCTYGMSGQWMNYSTSHTAFSFNMNDGTKLCFNDPRHFGTLKFHFGKDGTLKLNKKLLSLGPDMLNNPPDIKVFVQKLNKYPKKSLAEVLMNQKVISGVGNYIKAESLYRAKLAPNRTVDSLSMNDFSLLRESIIDVMKESYKNQGATISTYSNVDGSKGKSTAFFKVYKRKFDPFGNEIMQTATKDKRTTWWCPQIQK